ncbi:nucleotidyltransferase [Chitinophaga agrisoli]|uniref:Nucleotidyltransferase n=1 Tax=Chitinophaga agrisoli TaxID=2607653 RepID=A0A5B2VXJ6_9BACT|nr:nucleotidyltransferase [Chitinophaga agrisoli]KAA2244563.1 nucleotidyltransferase [Chitinophaga agrisoli]
MARTITEIQDDIINRMAATDGLADLNSTSKTAIWRMWTYIVAVTVWVLENLFDLHRTEVNTLINEKAPHSLRWYANKARDFQHGSDLIPEEDYYDNSRLSEDEIAARKIIAFSAVVEQERGLRIKVAKINEDDLGALSDVELQAFTEYMNRIKDAGVTPLIIDSLVADPLRLEMDIYYNPLVLDGNGARLDGTDPDPVGKRIKEYLRNLPFNGTMVLAYLVDAIQQVDGVVIPHIRHAQARYGDLPFTEIDVQYSPDAGYLRIVDNDADLQIKYFPQSVIL